MRYKKLREYTHEEFAQMVQKLDEKELLELSSNYGGYPVFFRMALDPRINHIPFIQTGSSVVIINQEGKILLQERTDRNMWCLPGGCQELGENLRNTAIRETLEETGIILNPEELILIDTVSGENRKNIYPNGDIVYNNTSLFLAKINTENVEKLVGDSETKSLNFFDINNLPENLMDSDLIDIYVKFLNQEKKI